MAGETAQALARVRDARRATAFGGGVAFPAAPAPMHSADLVALPSGALSAARSPGTVDNLRLPLTLFRSVWASDYETKAPTVPLRVMPDLTPAALVEVLAPGDAPLEVTGGLRGAKGTALDRAKTGHAVYALPFPLPEGVARNAQTVSAGHWLGIDLDGAPEAEVLRVLALLRAAGVWYLCFSTFNHGIKDTDKGWRVRVVLLLDRMAPTAEYRACYLAACALLGVEVGAGKAADKSNSNPAQLIGTWCAPSPAVVASSGAEAPVFPPFKEIGNGAALSVDALVAHGTVAPASALPVVAGGAKVSANDDLSAGLYAPASIDRIHEALRWIDPGAPYADWVGVGNLLHALRGQLGEDGALGLWVEWSGGAPAGRQANNDAGSGPMDKWATFRPTITAEVAERTLCLKAREGAALAARAARGAPGWTDQGAAALAYLGKHHRADLAEFRGADYPAAPVSPTAGFEFKADQYGNPVAIGRVGKLGRLEAFPVWDQSFVDALLLGAADEGRKLPGRDYVAQLQAVASARVRRDGARCVVWRRVAAPSPGSVVVDLGDPGGTVVRISRDGWQVAQGDGTLFARGGSYGTMPTPVGQAGAPTPDTTCAAWGHVLQTLARLGLQPRDAQLVAVVLLKWFIPAGAYPVLELLGPAGSGKTTAAQLLAMLIDPRSSGRAVTPRTLKVEEFAPMAQAHPVLVLDNLSRLAPAEQDMLCITATGAEIGTRTLHTTGQVTVFSVHARLVLTGITPAITRADLLDRCIRAQVSAPVRRQGEDELSSWFNGQKPQLLGALFTVLSAALQHLPGVKPATHRLVEFQRLGFAVFAAMGRNPDDFETLFAGHRAEIAGYNADADPFTRTLLAALEALEARAVAADELPGWRAWADKGKPGFVAIRKPGGEVVIAATPGGLLQLLKAHAPPEITLDRYRREAAIPPHVRGVEGGVTRVHPTLRDLGWHMARKLFSEKRAALVFMRAGPSPDRG